MPSRAALSARERQLRSRLRALLNKSEGFLHGSLIVMARRCGKAQCRCATSDEHKHRSLYLGQTRQGKSSMLYLTKHVHDQARQGVEDYQEALALLEGLNEEARKRLQKAKDQGKTVPKHSTARQAKKARSAERKSSKRS